MLHTNNPIIKHKVGLLNLAEELGEVSKACKVMGVPHDTFYHYQELVGSGGIDAPINKTRRSPNIKNRASDATEQAVIAHATDQLTMANTEPVINYVKKAYLYPVVACA